MSSEQSARKKLVITRKLTPNFQSRLEDLDNGKYEIVQWLGDGAMPRDEFLKAVRSASGILCLLTDKIDEELIKSAGDKLKVVSTMSVGYDHLDVDSLKRAGIAIGYTPEVLTDACADHVMAMILSYSRRIVEGVANVQSGEWPDFSPTWMCGNQFTGKTLGIFGMGRIGRAVAHRMIPFGISNIIYSVRPDCDPETLRAHDQQDERLSVIGSYFRLKQVKRVDFNDLLEQSDVLCISCSLNQKTRGIFDYECFKKMKNTSLLVNSSRGAVVNTFDIQRALEENLIAGACLDVTDPEPLNRKQFKALIENSKSLILPHISSATIETRDEMANLALDNLLRGVEGESLVHSVD